MRQYYYIYIFTDPLKGWYEYLTDDEVKRYRLAGYIVANAALEKVAQR